MVSFKTNIYGFLALSAVHQSLVLCFHFKISDPSNYESLFLSSIAQCWYKSLYNYEILLWEAFLINCPLWHFEFYYIFRWIRIQKIPNPSIKKGRILTLLHLSKQLPCYISWVDSDEIITRFKASLFSWTLRYYRTK